MAKLIQPDGSVSDHVPDEPPEWSLNALQFLVGGYIEMVRIRQGSDIEGGLAFCDEDGRAKGLPFNEMASGLLGYQYVGPILVIEEGEIVP